MKRPTRAALRCLAAAALLALSSTAFAGCSTSYSDKAKAYIPAKIGGRKATSKSRMAETLVDAFGKEEGISEAFAATVGNGCEGVDNFPDVVVVAAKSSEEKQMTRRDLEDLAKKLSGDPAVKVANEKVDGVETLTLRLDPTNPATGFSLAIANPPKTTVILYASAFCGGKARAIAGIKAMLAAGRS